MYAFTDLQAHPQSNSTVLSFDEDFSATLRKACDFDDDAMYLLCAAQIVWKEIFEKKYLFFQELNWTRCYCSLIALVRMILDLPSIKHQSETVVTILKAALSISQLLLFNSVKYRQGADPVHPSHERLTCI